MDEKGRRMTKDGVSSRRCQLLAAGGVGSWQWEVLALSNILI